MESSFPLTLSVDTPERIANWRALFAWFLAIPQLVVAGVLGYASSALGFISFFTVLFTKRVPDGIYRAQAMFLRYNLRASTYAMFLYETYPPFEFETVTADPGGNPAKLDFADPPVEMNRWLPFVKWLMLIPHVFALIVVGIGAFFAWIAAFFAVLFTGKYPAGIQRYLVGVQRWSLRVQMYYLFLTDVYPPFSLE